MKKACQYIRSARNEDQPNGSVLIQEKMNTAYAKKHKIEITETFIDAGFSGKNFNRPGWKELERKLAKNKNKVDYLIVTKYDRVSRNFFEGLEFMTMLEQKWNVKLISVQ